MQFLILAAGKPSLGYAKEGVELYLNRLRPSAKRNSSLSGHGSSQDVLNVCCRQRGLPAHRMDERGELWTSRKLVDLAKDWQMHSVRRIAFLIGASDGHTEELRSRCNHILSLSKFTLQHELALVVLLEQLYRCHTILAGTPYHR